MDAQGTPDTQDDTPHFDTVSGYQAELELETLLNQAFPVVPGSGFYADFPVWDPRHRAPIFRAVARRQGQLASCAGVRLAWMKAASGGAVAVGIIGGVATRPEFRGKGYASRCVEFVADWAESRGAAALVLWGSDPAFYQRLGFELCGRQARVPLDAWGSKPVASDGGAPGRGLTEGILQALESREGGLRLTRADHGWVRAHQHIEWRWSGSPERCDAYLAFNKGMDLQGLVHEWGGEPDALRSLLARVNAEVPGLSLIGQPEKLKMEGFLFDAEAIEPLCMAKVLNPGALATAFGITDAPRDPAVLFGTHQEAGRVPLWFWGLDSA